MHDYCVTSEKEHLALSQYEMRMSDNNSDSDKISIYCSGLSTVISNSEALVVKDNEQNIEPY